MLEWWGKSNPCTGRGTRLRAQDEQTLVPPEDSFFHYSSIPAFQYSYPSYYLVNSSFAGGELTNQCAIFQINVAQPPTAIATPNGIRHCSLSREGRLSRPAFRS